MSDLPENRRELLRQAAALLTVMRDAGFGYADGRLRSAAAPRRPAAIAAARAAAAPARPAPTPGATPLPIGSREALRAILADPFAALPARAAAEPAPVPAAQPARAPTPAPPPTSAGSVDFWTGAETTMKSDCMELQNRLAAADSLEAIHALVRECCCCDLGACRTNGVPGEGDPRASLVFIGEGPGYYEDVQGRPFVGKAGQLLNDMIRAMGLAREEVYITNIVKCRPPNNREPTPEEMRACRPFLEKQLTFIRPKVICTLGRIAIQGLLFQSTPISQLRGRWLEYLGVPVMPTFHPAYLLRNPEQKKAAWKDLQAIMAKLKDLGCS